ncbi:MAG TPA: GNAT family N-acetyltransferase [Solirubrobacteraceae bacterium]|jgi:RimJ/RimL family protein N-acetyltransferase
MSRIVLPGEPLTDGPTALRPWRDTDLDALVAACQDPEIGRLTRVPRPYRETDARAYLLHRYDAIHAGSGAPFAIVDAGHGGLLGSIALNEIDWVHERAGVGYWLAREARGAGHASRAVRMICAWGFRTLPLGRIELLAATGNAPSQRVAERAGFIREGVLRSYLRLADGRQDMVAFGLLRSDRPATT